MFFGNRKHSYSFFIAQTAWKKKMKGLRSMTARFLSDTSLARVEIEMQQIPGFRPRASGMSVSRFSYTPSDCDCRSCTYQAGRNKCGSPTGCICLRERLVAGCVPLAELLAILAAEVAIPPFVSRVSRLSKQDNSAFRNEAHRHRFEAAQQRNLTDTIPQMAAVYLLTADSFLWGKSQAAAIPERIDFKTIQIHGVDLDGYVLFHTAKDLYSGTKHISLSELTDPELVSDEAFRVIITAFLIRRYGAEVLCAERSGK